MNYKSSDNTETKIGIHDKHRFEIKMNVPMPRGRHASYSVETFFFIPRALNINLNTFSRNDFYSILQRYIRFRTPQISMKRLMDTSLATSPFTRFRQCIKDFLTGKADKSLVDLAYSEIRLMGTVIRGGLRDFVRRFFCDLDFISEDSPCANLQMIDLARDADAFLDDVEQLVVELMNIKTDIKYPSIPEKVREAFLYLDEFASIIIEDYLTEALKGLRDKYHGKNAFSAIKEVDSRLERIIIGQQQHRMAMRYPSVLGFSANNRMLPYRRGVLKKFISSILYLNIEISEWEIHRQLYFAVSAAVAMFIGAVAIAVAQNRYATTSWPFITVVVLSYVFRDRLKDLLRQNFSKRMARWIADRRTLIKDPVSGATIGNLKEAFSFIDIGNVPAEILYQRNIDNFTSIEGEGKPEQILKYDREVQLFPGKIFRFHERLKDLNDIIRLSVDRFLIQADNPTVKQLYLEPVQKKIEHVECERVYHLNIVIKYRYGDDHLRRKISYNRIRVVMTRDGIVALEEVTQKA